MLGVTLSKDARARAIQLPAWNEALGLPRPWDQQWSLRMQQVLAYESDLLEHDDLFAGSHVVEAQTARLVEAARDEIERVLAMGGAVAAVESGYLKSELVAAHAAPPRAPGERRGRGRRRQRVHDDRAEPAAGRTPTARGRDRRPRGRGRRRWPSSPPGARRATTRPVAAALDALRAAAAGTDNLVPATLACARAGVTTGEWAGALREVFGEYRAPTGVSGVAVVPLGTGGVGHGTDPELVRAAVRATGEELGGRLRLLVGKPGLDGHSNGAEQVAVRARDAGFEVVYQGIRLTPAEIVAAAVEEDVHCVGLSVLSGSHLSVVPQVLDGLRAAGVVDVPVVVGGIIPDADAVVLRALGVADVFTPKDYDLGAVMLRIVAAIRAARGLPPAAEPAA